MASRSLGFLVLLALGAATVASHAAAAPPVNRGPRPASYDIRAFGALPDGKTKATDAIRKAISAAAAAGGGTILFSGGTFLTGPIHLRSNITLSVDAGTVLKFSADFDDYLPMVRSRWEGTEVVSFSPLIYGDKVENVGIVGRGTIDGNGKPWWDFFRALKADAKKTGTWKTDSKWQKEFARLNTDRADWPDDRKMLEMGFLRPPMIQLLDCKRLTIEGLTLRDPPFWTVNPVYCDDVTVRGVTIANPDDAPNTDGIDPESCRNVHISDSHINAGDDCITIKSGRDKQGRKIGRPAENYTITNCTMLHGHGGVVIGSEMSGDVRRIAISNCVFEGTDRGIRIKSTRGRGGVVEDVRVSNIVMRRIRDEAVTLNMFYTDAPAEPLSERTPRFRNIHMSGIVGDAGQAGTLLGLPEAPLEDVSLDDVALTATKGLVIRDARNVALRAVRIDTTAGPAVVAERTEALELFGVRTHAPHAGTPVIDLGNVRRVFVHGSFPIPGTEPFVNVRGRDVASVVLGDNDFADVRTPAVVVGKDVPGNAVRSAK